MQQLIDSRQSRLKINHYVSYSSNLNTTFILVLLWLTSVCWVKKLNTLKWDILATGVVSENGNFSQVLLIQLTLQSI